MSTFMVHIAVVLEFEADDLEEAREEADAARGSMGSAVIDLFPSEFAYVEVEDVGEVP